MLVKLALSFMTLGSHFASIAISANVMRTDLIPVRKKPVVGIDVDGELAWSMSVTRSATSCLPIVSGQQAAGCGQAGKRASGQPGLVTY